MSSRRETRWASSLSRLCFSGRTPLSEHDGALRFHDHHAAQHPRHDLWILELDQPAFALPAQPACHRVGGSLDGGFPCRFNDRKNRQIPHRLEKRDYVQVRNESAADGLWKINNARRVVYAKKTLPLRDRMEAVKDLADR
jgi:hypothetical protein